jgi:hypothetical protein
VALQTKSRAKFFVTVVHRANEFAVVERFVLACQHLFELNHHLGVSLVTLLAYVIRLLIVYARSLKGSL